MAFWVDIADTLQRDELLQDLSREQSEAIVDALHLLVYADGQESVLERAELEQLLYELPWALSEGDQLKAYMEKSAACLKQACTRGTDGLSQAAAGIAERLEGLKLRKRALQMAATVAYADWHAGDPERQALFALAEAFEIPRPFASAIIADSEKDAHAVTSLDEPTEPQPGELGTAASPSGGVTSTSFLDGFFDDLFEDDDALLRLEPDEAMAFVDALSMALIADGPPTAEELHAFKAELERLPFSADDAKRVRLRVESCLHTLGVTRERDLDAMIASVAAKLPSPALRQRALRMAIEITRGDLEITLKERVMLSRLARAFGVSRDELEALVSEASEDTEEEPA